MIILGIETSCDETALALLSASGGVSDLQFSVLAEVIHSQVELHKKFGGVFPMMAKREHAKNLIPLFRQLLTQSGYLTQRTKPDPHIHSDVLKNIRIDVSREKELWELFFTLIPTIEKPPIDAIAVTKGPGLEPALWVGINFAKALSMFWNIPLVALNHMEGHLFSVLLPRNEVPISPSTSSPGPRDNFQFPLVALLVSGGHTELILVHDWLTYSPLGATRDDAVGEAFDKVARMLGLPYPGGPEIERLAHIARTRKYPTVFTLPRPMRTSPDFDFSFSGLKTSVLYQRQRLGTLSAKQQAAIAREFEDAVTEVLLVKTKRAIETYAAKTLVVAGGVIANTHLRKSMETLAASVGTTLFVPPLKLSTDNALMIAVAAYLHLTLGIEPLQKEEMQTLSANGSLSLSVPKKD